ncbi:MAG: glycerate kinase [Acidovorax sp. SCN 65-108]|nr:MAG: glycerate kinase [Acidovorax sp. SCN 65-108]
MNLRNILVPLGAVGLVGFGFYAYGWAGVAAVVGGLVMWALLHFTRLVNVVMLNARLAEGVNLMHVVAMTQALGELLSPEGADPEVYRWTDGTQSHVTCEFRRGKLAKWTLVRPEGEAAATPPQG